MTLPSFYDRVDSSTKLIVNEGATPMDKDKINWPMVTLLGILGVGFLAAITLLALNDKDTQIVLTVAVLLLGAAGYSIHGTLSQVKENSNGRMSQMQEQQDKLIAMVADLAIRVPTSVATSSSVNDPTQELRVLRGSSEDRP